MVHSAIRLGACILGLSLLVACSQGDIPAPDADRSFEAVEPGLLQDPRFERIEGSAEAPVWILTQHAGPLSYTVEAEEGVARIERIGGEPWGHFAQILRDDALSGQWLEFSVELRAALDDSYGAPMQATGPTVLVRGRLPSDPPMLGMRILHASDTESPLDPGAHPWRRHALLFAVPEAVALEVTVAVQLTHGGWIEIRNPRLVAVEPPAE